MSANGDGYNVRTPAWECEWSDCDYASDDLADIRQHEDTAHQDEHDDHYSEADFGGVFDGFTVSSDADPGL